MNDKKYRGEVNGGVQEFWNDIDKERHKYSERYANRFVPPRLQPIGAERSNRTVNFGYSDVEFSWERNTFQQIPVPDFVGSQNDTDHVLKDKISTLNSPDDHSSQKSGMISNKSKNGYKIQRHYYNEQKTNEETTRGQCDQKKCYNPRSFQYIRKTDITTNNDYSKTDILRDNKHSESNSLKYKSQNKIGKDQANQKLLLNESTEAHRSSEQHLYKKEHQNTCRTKYLESGYRTDNEERRNVSKTKPQIKEQQNTYRIKYPESGYRTDNEKRINVLKTKPQRKEQQNTYRTKYPKSGYRTDNRERRNVLKTKPQRKEQRNTYGTKYPEHGYRTDNEERRKVSKTEPLLFYYGNKNEEELHYEHRMTDRNVLTNRKCESSLNENQNENKIQWKNRVEDMLDNDYYSPTMKGTTQIFNNADKSRNNVHETKVKHNVMQHNGRVIHPNDKNQYRNRPKKDFHCQMKNELVDNRAGKNKHNQEFNNDFSTQNVNKMEVPDITWKIINPIKSEVKSAVIDSETYNKNTDTMLKFTPKSNLTDSVSDLYSKLNISCELSPESKSNLVINDGRKSSGTETKDIPETEGHRLDDLLTNSNHARDDDTRELIRTINNMLEMVTGCRRAVNMYLHIYNEQWCGIRRHTIEQLEKLISEVKIEQKKGFNLREFLGIGGKIAKNVGAFFPHPAAKIAVVVGQLVELIAHVLQDTPVQFNVQEFDIIKSLQKDVDVSDDLFLYSLQCNRQLDEARNLFDDFHNSVVKGKFQESGLKNFLHEVADLCPAHGSFYLQVYFAIKRLNEFRGSVVYQAFCHGFADEQELAKAFESLNWRCNVSADGSSVIAWGEIEKLLENTTHSNKTDLMEKIRGCIRVLSQEERNLNKNIKLLLM